MASRESSYIQTRSVKAAAAALRKRRGRAENRSGVRVVVVVVTGSLITDLISWSFREKLCRAKVDINAELKCRYLKCCSI